MTERLKVYLSGIQAGYLTWDSELDVFSFRYISDYLGRDRAVPISKSLPLREDAFDALASRTFFENLLPPEVVRRKLEKILHHDWRNTFAFLKELGGDLPQKIVRPEGFKAKVDQQSLTEKAFARRLHRIYVELNMAWNGRRDKTFVTNKRAICRRRVFSSAFATGCHNMWRKCLRICSMEDENVVES